MHRVITCPERWRMETKSECGGQTEREHLANIFKKAYRDTQIGLTLLSVHIVRCSYEEGFIYSVTQKKHFISDMFSEEKIVCALQTHSIW